MENIHELLRIEGASKRFYQKGNKSILAVDNVSFEIQSNDYIGIVGESGCGKTTLLRLLSASISPDSGRVYIRNVDTSDKNLKDLRSVRSDLAVVYQNVLESVNPRMKVLDVVLEPLYYRPRLNRNDKLQKVLDLFAKMDLPSQYINRYPHETSAGELQRICIARALITNPRLVLFDEPISNLDVISQMKIIKLIQRLKEENSFAYIFVSHNIGAITMLCKTIFTMDKGRFIDSVFV
jgi:ABC-type glutathione transport system ATPase component